MKKLSLICLTLLGLGLSSVIMANPDAENQGNANMLLKYTENKEYVALPNAVDKAPEVVEFFSFYCPHCFDYETKYGITKKIKENLPENIKLTKYHVEFMGGLSKELSEAWAVANALGVDETVGPMIFDAIHVDRSLRTVSDIIKIFEKAGVTEQQFNDAKNSISVGILVKKQEKAVEEFSVRSVPTFYVEGKYMVNAQGLSKSKPYDEQYSDVINFLLKK